MKLFSAISFLVIGLAIAGEAVADDGSRSRGLGNFGIAPAPSKLIDSQSGAAAKAKPLEAVIEAIKRRLPGRALGARLVEWQGQDAYEIRWMGKNGKVHDITADAASGKILDER